ncbi:sulfite exporter TauE/SafE family protein [Luteibacter aegosomaticola]|uniref:sulfite exporter TauE/SafE family protein n=1 Tax=Luteibacter aegosomaticola TaxID=2911538 RepID=UPI001FF9450E|nr:sulfite exporter TauE/SafE family protein [Luteibacter aegosomaticola]UPG90546.1 sulfite exporter TauE/SafE family protein [Luteibacter aegosomaticola]
MSSPVFLMLLAAFGASALGGVLGMASGIFIVPALTLFFGVDMHDAVGISLVSVIACSCATAAPFIKREWTNVRLAVVLETATTTGALCGVLLTGWLPVRLLQLLFVGVLGISARQMMVKRNDPVPEAASDRLTLATRLRLHDVYAEAGTDRPVAYRVGNVPVALVLMYVAGVLSALLGIGSGVLKIPAMDMALRMPIKASSATSNFMIGVTAATGACAYIARGDLNVTLAAPIALGSVLGALVGAKLLSALPADKLRLGFVGVLVAMMAMMAISAIRG